MIVFLAIFFLIKFFSIKDLPFFGDFMKEIDRIDRKILRAMQDDGRLTNLELAEKISLSPTATAERLKRLTRDGYITGYTARCPPRSSTAACWCSSRSSWTAPHRMFRRLFACRSKSDDVMECHMVAGGFDYLVKARVRAWKPTAAFCQTSSCPCPAFARPTHILSWKK
jgi:Lrp/AsnC family leucine-responsive transcriptional regulator